MPSHQKAVCLMGEWLVFKVGGNGFIKSVEGVGTYVNHRRRLWEAARARAPNNLDGSKYPLFEYYQKF